MSAAGFPIERQRQARQRAWRGFRLAMSIALLVWPALFVAIPALADIAVPPLRGRVTDLTGTLSVEQQAAMEQRLAAFERRKGSQIAVLIVPTTQPETVEQYALRVVETWKLGRKRIDDGVLLLVAKDDRRLRIEVGYGLEGVLPDAAARRIIDEAITPRFKQGDFHGGIGAGLDRLVAAVDRESLPPAQAQGKAGAARGETIQLAWHPLFLLLLVGIAYFAMRLSRAFLGSSWWAVAIAAVSALAAWMLVDQAQPFVIAAALAFMGAGFFIYRTRPDVSTFTVIDGRMSGTTGFGGAVKSREFSEWSWARSDRGSGGDSSSGVSGGGGDFGGGGASGSW